MNTEIQPLLVTPQPNPAESLQGFILRTSEANGYDSPSRILSYAGMGWEEYHSARPSLEKLAALHGRNVDSLMGFGCMPDTPVPRRKGKHQTVMGHTLPIKYFLSKHTRICPECILELGVVESYWELRYAFACPIHKRYAIANCPVCDQPLDWFRRGLLVCRCGADLTQSRGKMLRQGGMLALLGLIRNKLRREPMDKALLEASGFPIEAMAQISLATLLGMIDRFEHSIRHHEAYQSMAGVTVETIGLSGAADILANWPRGLHEYLVRVHLDSRAQGLRGRYDSFYETFLKSGLPANEMEFLQKAFLEFGQQRWVLPGSEKLHGKAAPQIIIVDSEGGRHESLISSEGGSLGLKEASVRVGLPPGVLKLLRQGGIYKARYLTDPVGSFHEKDLDRFRSELMGSVQEIPKPNSVQYVSLSEVMKMRLGTQQIKADVVAAIHDRTLKSAGRIGDSPGKLILVRSQVVEFLKESAARNSGLLSTGETAKRLVCSKEVIRQLALDGVLEHVEKPLGVFIKHESLAKFSEQYVSCLAIARANACGVRKIMHMCEVAGVRLMSFQRSSGCSAQPFIKREQLGLLGF